MTSSGVAWAHDVDDYPASGWKYSGSLLDRHFYQAPTKWPNSFNGRTSDAMDRWTNLPGSAYSFGLSPDAASDSWGCGTTWDHLTTASLTGATAITDTCPAVNSTMRIRVNSNFTWYTGSSTPNPADEYDLQATMTHELGHAHQAWLTCTMGGPDDPCEGAHYDTTINGLICNFAIETTYHTMCTPALGGDQKWRRRSLETHDKDLVEGMY